MKAHYCIAAVLLIALSLDSQQTSLQPFSEFEKQLSIEPAGFSGNKERLSKVFDADRRRLGNNFETELLKWLGEDIERHYWISFFLESESYLHGNQRLPHLALLIKEQGLSFVRGHDDQESLRRVVGLSITAATLSSELGLEALARSYKNEAENLLSRHAELKGAVPGMLVEERRRYDEIKRWGTSKVLSVTGDPNPPPKATISGGILNGRSLNLVKPSYPPAAREAGASGKVEVRVVIDESGKVIWAKAQSGHPLLREACENAAWKTNFPVTKLSGQPVKVSGILLYTFVP